MGSIPGGSAARVSHMGLKDTRHMTVVNPGR